MAVNGHPYRKNIVTVHMWKLVHIQIKMADNDQPYVKNKNDKYQYWRIKEIIYVKET